MLARSSSQGALALLIRCPVPCSTLMHVLADVSRNSHPSVLAIASPSDFSTSRLLLMSHLLPTRMSGMDVVSFTRMICSLNWWCGGTRWETPTGPRVSPSALPTPRARKHSAGGPYAANALKRRSGDDGVHQHKAFAVPDPLVPQRRVLFLPGGIKHLQVPIAPSEMAAAPGAVSGRMRQPAYT